MARVVGLSWVLQSGEASARPNIVYILADDLALEP
jgi:hypothetical protein